LIEQFLGKKAQIEFQPRHPADVPATWADITRARELLVGNLKSALRKGYRKAKPSVSEANRGQWSGIWRIESGLKMLGVLSIRACTERSEVLKGREGWKEGWMIRWVEGYNFSYSDTLFSVGGK